MAHAISRGLCSILCGNNAWECSPIAERPWLFGNSPSIICTKTMRRATGEHTGAVRHSNQGVMSGRNRRPKTKEDMCLIHGFCRGYYIDF